MPLGHISTKVSEITGLTLGRLGGRRTLLHHGKAVESHPIREVLSDFLQWLEDCRGNVTNLIKKCLDLLTDIH